MQRKLSPPSISHAILILVVLFLSFLKMAWILLRLLLGFKNKSIVTCSSSRLLSEFQWPLIGSIRHSQGKFMVSPMGGSFEVSSTQSLDMICSRSMLFLFSSFRIQVELVLMHWHRYSRSIPTYQQSLEAKLILWSLLISGEDMKIIRSSKVEGFPAMLGFPRFSLYFAKFENVWMCSNLFFFIAFKSYFFVSEKIFFFPVFSFEGCFLNRWLASREISRSLLALCSEEFLNLCRLASKRGLILGGFVYLNDQ